MLWLCHIVFKWFKRVFIVTDCSMWERLCSPSQTQEKRTLLYSFYLLVTHPCNPNPCKRNKVCDINRTCYAAALDGCEAHTCVPGKIFFISLPWVKLDFHCLQPVSINSGSAQKWVFWIGQFLVSNVHGDKLMHELPHRMFDWQAVHLEMLQVFLCGWENMLE